jgi:hypothetical protein
MTPYDDPKMQRVVRLCRSFAEASEVDLDQWLDLSGDERLRIGEAMRQEAFGSDESGLPRILRVAERQER